MDIQIQRKDLLPALMRAQSVLPGSTTLPILTNYWLTAEDGSLEISASDLEIFYTEKVPANIFEMGIAAVPGKKLTEIVKGAGEETITIKDGKDGRLLISVFELKKQPPEDFPEKPLSEIGAPVNGESLSSLLASTIYAASKENSLGALSGIYLHTEEGLLIAVCTDGHRLAMAKASAEGFELSPDGIIIPQKGAKELLKLAENTEKLNLSISEKLFTAKTEKKSLSIRLMEGHYPDYKRVLPEPTETMLVNRKELLGAVRRASMFSINSQPITIRPRDNILQIAFTGETEKSNEELPISFKPVEPVEIGTNPYYVSEALAALTGEIASIGFIPDGGTVRKPIVITGAGNNVTNLIMPTIL